MLGKLDARPAEEKKGPDRGIDGRLYLHDEAVGAKSKLILFSVKAGHLTVSYVRDLVGTMQRENANIGVFVSLEEPTREMRREAAAAGFYTSPAIQTKHARIQLLTVNEILNGKGVDYPLPQGNVTFRRAQRVRERDPAENLDMFDGEPAKVPAESARAVPPRNRRR